MPYEICLKSLVAGLLGTLACGMGVLPLLLRRVDVRQHTGLAYGFAGGLMFAASVYNLILPALTTAEYSMPIWRVIPVTGGVIAGALMVWGSWHLLHRDAKGKRRFDSPDWGGRVGLLVLITMFIHSIPEGLAIGVGFASDAVYSNGLGLYLAIAICVHNIPEGLAVAIAMRAGNASIGRCFWAAVLSNLPQPIAAVPASAVSWLFRPLIEPIMSLAAGAMIFLILIELIPDSLNRIHPNAAAWAFVIGFCTMLLVQAAL